MPTEVSPNEHMMRKPGSLQLDPSGEGVAIDETKRLIASNKVEGHEAFRLIHRPPKVAAVFGTCVAETILASVHVRARQQAGHMDASDLIRALPNTLARSGPSTYGLRREKARSNERDYHVGHSPPTRSVSSFRCWPTISAITNEHIERSDL